MSMIRYIRDEFLILGSTRIPGSYIYGIEEVDYKNTLWMCCILTERKGSYLFQMFAYFFCLKKEKLLVSLKLFTSIILPIKYD